MLNYRFGVVGVKFVQYHCIVKRTIYIKDTGHTLTGRPRKQVKRCKLSNSNNRKSETLVQASAMHMEFMNIAQKLKRADAKKAARRAKRSR